MTVYLSVEQVLRIHSGLVRAPVVRELDRIDAAVARPKAAWGDEEAYPTLAAKAAALLHWLASSQGFEDGNKRTAWLATVAFLEVNGQELGDVPPIEAEAFAMAVAVSAWGEGTVAKATEWLAHRLALG